MADVVPTSIKSDLITGQVDLDTDTLYVMLATASYTPSASHNRRDDVTNEASGTGYTAGGQALGTVTVSTSGTDVIADAADAVWASSTISARYAIVYKHRGGASSADELVVIKDLGSTIASTNGSFTVQWHATDGFLKLS